MSFTHDVSWTPSEKVDLLVNVLQNAFPDLPSILYQIILDHHVYPKWNDIPLPKGRSLNSSQLAYDEMSRLYRQPGGRPQQTQLQPHPQPPMVPQIQLQYPQPAAPTLRPYVEPDPFYSQQRILQPRPPRSTDSPAPTVTNGETPILQRPMPLDLFQEPRRKRGRPSKEEAEERDRALALEGRVYLPKKRANKKPRTSIMGVGSESVVDTSPSAPRPPPAQPVVPKEEDSSNQETMRRLEEDRPAESNRNNEQDGVEHTAAQSDRGQFNAQSPSDRLLASHRERERDRDRDDLQTTVTSSQPIPRSTPQSELPSNQYGNYERSIPPTSVDQR